MMEEWSCRFHDGDEHAAPEVIQKGLDTQVPPDRRRLSSRRKPATRFRQEATRQVRYKRMRGCSDEQMRFLARQEARTTTG